MLSRVGIGADSARVRASLEELDRRMAPLQKQLDQLGPQIEAAKTKADFLAAEYQSRLGDYLNEPDNARRLLDPRLARRSFIGRPSFPRTPARCMVG